MAKSHFASSHVCLKRGVTVYQPHCLGCSWEGRETTDMNNADEQCQTHMAMS